MNLPKSTIFGLLLIILAAFVFDPFEFIADQMLQGLGMLGCSLLILAYGVIGVCRGRFFFSGHHNAALDGRREMFWIYAVNYNAIGLFATLMSLYNLGVFGG